MNTKKYSGIVIPSVTPLTADHQLDTEGVKNIFDFFYRNRVHPFILGTTGEAASLPFSLKKTFLETAAKLKKENTTLYAGISSNVFAESVGLAKHAFENNTNVVVATLPSYYALEPSAMLRYFEELADAVNGPMMIYNIPATTHMSIPLDVIDQLSHHPFVVGVKDSERSDERLTASLELWRNREDFSYLLGWAGRSGLALQSGADGLVPSTGNFAPGVYIRLWEAVKAGNKTLSNQLQQSSDQLGELYQKGRNLGTSLWALKVIMREIGLCESNVMPPVYAQSPEEEQELMDAFRMVSGER